MLKNKHSLLIIVAALGYFVDIYDLILFNVIKNPSLKELGFDGAELDNRGIDLFNMQMLGMLAGGVLWGVFGDLRGRLSVLFGSIFLYSAANIANGFVQDTFTYSIIRFIAGIGLAGELGAGITMVTEVMDKEKRGIGTMVVVVFGALGAVLAAYIGDRFQWRTAYFIGGGMGLLLLALRVGIYESGMFEHAKKAGASRGAFHLLFTDRKRCFKYINCILIGLPVWFVIGVLISLSYKFGETIGVQGTVVNGTSIMFAYIGLSVGDLLSGLLSQLMKSRKKVVLLFIIANGLLTIWFLMFANGISLPFFYFLCFLLGTATGFWALFVTIAAEQFGTNIRSTVTTTVPNFVRGAVVPITLGYKALVPAYGMVYAALIVGMICMILALVATFSIEETFGKDLNYLEEME